MIISTKIFQIVQMQKLQQYGDVIEKEYNYVYIVKIEEGNFKGKKFYLLVDKKENQKLKYGNLVEISGDYIAPSIARNYDGFNYREYLKTKKIYGSIKLDSDIKIIQKNRMNIMLILSNKIRNYIVNVANKLLSQDTSKLLVGSIWSTYFIYNICNNIYIKQK